LDALRAVVATVVHNDEWDETLLHVTFGGNTYVSSATKVSRFEFVHGFKTQVPLTLRLAADTATTGLIGDKNLAGQCPWHNALPTHSERKMRIWMIDFISKVV